MRSRAPSALTRLLPLGGPPPRGVGRRARIWIRSHVPGAAEQSGGRPREDLQVEPDRAMLDVPDVELDPLLPGDAGAAVDLRPAGDPRAQVEAPSLARRIELDLCREGRAWADDPHLAAQHVDQVRELVEGES